MIQEKLKYIISQAKNSNPLFLRSLLKEGIQDHILNFVYNHRQYKKLIFTGGTCLRKIYGLPRLSEDLDFDFLKEFSIKIFSQDLKKFFIQDLQYVKVETKISGNQKTVFLILPEILKDIGLTKGQAQSQKLFVRCDFSQEKPGLWQTEINSISTLEFTFFVLSYDLATLFSHKIGAFLEREFFKGKKQTIAFKGRDVFDLVWFFQRAQKTNLRPNWLRLYQILKIKNKKKIMDLLIEKLRKIDKKSLLKDLEPFLESKQTLSTFAENFLEIIEVKIKTV